MADPVSAEPDNWEDDIILKVSMPGKNLREATKYKIKMAEEKARQREAMKKVKLEQNSMIQKIQQPQVEIQKPVQVQPQIENVQKVENIQSVQNEELNVNEQKQLEAQEAIVEEEQIGNDIQEEVENIQEQTTEVQQEIADVKEEINEAEQIVEDLQEEVEDVDINIRNADEVQDETIEVKEEVVQIEEPMTEPVKEIIEEQPQEDVLTELSMGNQQSLQIAQPEAKKKDDVYVPKVDMSKIEGIAKGIYTRDFSFNKKPKKF